MRILLLILTLCTFSLTQTTLAQVATEAPQRELKSGVEQMEDKLQEMKTTLDLTSEQVKEIRAVNTDFAEKMKMVTSSDKSEMRKNVIKYKAQRKRAYQKYMTPDQFKAWLETQKG